MKPAGMNVSKTETPKRTISGKKGQSIIGKVKKIVLKYGLDDESWAEAISSQYFLLCLAKQLKLEKDDYYNLINKCLVPFRVTYDASLVLDDNNILITPEETCKITKCMQEEDEKDPYFTRYAKMRADRIDPQRMYLNFHFGLLVRNASTNKDSDILKKVKKLCLDRLTSKTAIDTSGGWYPYRVPWITGRILISLNAIDFSEYDKSKELKDTIDDAIDSLYRRINEDGPYWRSGVGDWVTKWESTALCLEALNTCGSIDNHKNEIQKILAYVCDQNQTQEWLNCKVDFSEANSANLVLAAVTLASVVYRITNKYFEELYESLKESIISFFEKVIAQIDRQGVGAVQQYCTLPQILHYVVAAFEEEEQEETE